MTTLKSKLILPDDIKFISISATKRLLMVNKYTFAQRNQKRYFYCSQISKGCKAKIFLSKDETEVTYADNNHSHPPPNYMLMKIPAKFSRIDGRLRQRIVAMHKNNIPITEIADELGVSRNTVYLWIRRWKEEGSLSSHKACGRPRKTTAFEDQQILQAYCQNLKVTDVAKASKISTASLRRRLREAGLLATKIPRKKVRVRSCTADVLSSFEEHRPDINQSDMRQSDLNLQPDIGLQSDIGRQTDIGLTNMGLPSDMRQTDLGRITTDIRPLSDIGRLA